MSLFPLAMRLLPPESAELKAQLLHLKTGGIVTDFGLQSLSSSSSLYDTRNTEHDPPYWRGPVWINVNFLVLASLAHYAQVSLCSPSEGFSSLPPPLRSCEARSAVIGAVDCIQQSNKRPGCYVGSDC